MTFQSSRILYIKAIFLFLVFLLIPPPPTWAQEITWIRQFGTSDFNDLAAVVFVYSGAVYVSGHFSHLDGSIQGPTDTGNI